ncbi:hypothetical protein ACKWRH_28215 [Bradyrhizobium sp. Pa8]|uniref:hypothetical protein n=1 Tax=Bradyrhizobium sp. Pa8 TaxID=3386552 RepID=UPI00403F480B
MSNEQHEAAYGSDLPIYVLEADHVIEKELGDPRLTYISDCIVISTARTAEGSTALCRKVTKIWIDLLWDGYLCRGAISGGPLIHERGFLLGSAYMDAFKLESEASVPRVIIDKGLREIYDNYPSRFPLYPPTIEKSSDEYLYLRYFPFQFFPPYAFDWSTYLLAARRHLHRGLTESPERIRSKFSFAKDEFNFAVNTYRGMLDPLVQPIED